MPALTTPATARAPGAHPSALAFLLRRLSALAYAAADRLTSPQRDVPPEFYRFPPF